MLKSSSICDPFSARILIASCLHEKSIKFLALWSSLKYQRKPIRFDDLKTFDIHFLNWLESLLRIVYHSHKSNTCINVEVCFTGSIEAVLFVTFDLARPCKLRDIWSDEASLEIRSYCSIDRRYVGVICSVWSHDHLVAIPKFPLNFAADQVFTDFKSFHIDGAGLRLLSAFRTNVVQSLSFSPENDDPGWRVLVIRVFVQELSLVFLIDWENVLTCSLYLHQQIPWLLSLSFDVDGSVEKSRVELADNNLSEVDLEILPRHVEGAIIRIAIVVVFVP